MQRLGGGRAHFHLYRDQFSSDSQTVWDGSLLKCNEAVNFFVWSSDVWKLRFWTIFKKVWQKMDSWGRRFSQKKFSKNSKKWWKFFSLFLFLLCSIECIVSSRLDTMTIKPFLLPLYSQTARQITFSKWWEKSVKIIKKSKNVEKFFLCLVFIGSSSEFSCVDPLMKETF